MPFILAARMWNSGELTDDDRRGLVGDLTRRGLTRTEIADALSIDEAMVADHLG